MGLFHRKHSSPQPQPPAQQPLANHRVMKNIVYFSNWLVYARKHFAIDIPVQLVSHIFYAFCHINADSGKLKFTDEWCDLQLPMTDPRDGSKQVVGSLQQLYALKQKHRHLKVVLLIGGWGTEGQFQAMVANKGKMAAFIDLCGEFVEEYGFDGIDVDWEYPQRHEMPQFVELLRGIHKKLKAIDTRLSLSIAAPAGHDKIDAFDIKAVDQYLTFWNLMLYDFAGGWLQKTGFHSNLFGDNGDNPLNVDDIVKRYASSGVAREKLVMGMPLYGRAFFGANGAGIGQPFSKERGPNPPVDQDTVDYNKLPLGSQEMDPRKVLALCFDRGVFISYDNVDCTKIKARYVMSNGLGGGMWWDSAGDKKGDESLVETFAKEVGVERVENIIGYSKSKYLAGM